MVVAWDPPFALKIGRISSTKCHDAHIHSASMSGFPSLDCWWGSGSRKGPSARLLLALGILYRSLEILWGYNLGLQFPLLYGSSSFGDSSCFGVTLSHSNMATWHDPNPSGTMLVYWDKRATRLPCNSSLKVTQSCHFR